LSAVARHKQQTLEATFDREEDTPDQSCRRKLGSVEVVPGSTTKRKGQFGDPIDILHPTTKAKGANIVSIRVPGRY